MLRIEMVYLEAQNEQSQRCQEMAKMRAQLKES
jgi:hypothetical protein